MCSGEENLTSKADLLLPMALAVDRTYCYPLKTVVKENRKPVFGGSSHCLIMRQYLKERVSH